MGKLNLFVIALLFLTLPLFFYKLGQSSLVSFDEAWYAEISKNILKTNDLFNLYFNGKPYYDHPPAGFWLEALTFKIFGVSEFGARFPQAAAGFLSLGLVYFLGKELFNRIVGFASALGLASSFWFIFRARSGNLDILLTFLFLLTLLLAVKAVKKKIYLTPLALSLSFLFLTKTLVPLTIIPVLIILLWGQKLRLKDLIKPGLIFLIIVGGWIVNGLIKQPDFISRYLMIGLPGVNTQTDHSANFKQIKEYLHSGVGKWFWLGVASIAVGLILRQRRFFALSAFFIIFFLPFIFSTRGNIWHLIPLYPVMILSFFGFAHYLLGTFLKLTLSSLRKQGSITGGYSLLIQWIPAFTGMTILIVSFYVSFIQIRQMWYQFIDIPKFVSDEAILSKEAGKYPYELILDEDFLPAAVFYSGKSAKIISRDEFIPYFENEESFLMITKQERLDGSKISKGKYQILKSDRDKILLLKLI